MHAKNRINILIAAMIVAFLMGLLFGSGAAAEDAKGQVSKLTIPAPSLAGNLLNESLQQPIAVYLPPSYGDGQKSYPVVYFLIGWGESVNDYIGGPYLKLADVMNRIIGNGTASEMIVVIVNGRNVLNGSFYVNSPVTGNWEDWVTNDVVSYVDSNYRTIKNARSRALAGHSMGGFGALSIGMHHPELFSCVYAHSPGLFDETGMSKMHMFNSKAMIERYLKLSDTLAALTPDAARKKFISTTSPYEINFTYGYGAAFAPDTSKPVPYTNYPYKMDGGALVRDEALWKAWDSGFGGLSDKVKAYKADLMSLNALVIECGRRDSYPWIPKGSEYLSSLLTAEGVAHQFTAYDGGHEDKLPQRIEKFMLPFLSGKLER